jgi:hypothetical protein
MSKPATLDSFATDATWTSPGDPWDGADVRTAPADPEQGFKPTARVAADELNHILGQFRDWLAHYKDYGASVDIANTFTGETIFDDAVTFSSTVALADVLTLEGSARIRERTPVTLPNADDSVSAADADVFIVPNISAPRTYTILGGTVGDTITFLGHLNISGNDATIAATTLRSPTAPAIRNASGKYWSMTFKCIATNDWALAGGIIVP